MRQGPSPVFTSKFCHFLVPRVFPVVDNEAMKNTHTYEGYFRYVQDQWALTAPDDRVALTAPVRDSPTEARTDRLQRQPRRPRPRPGQRLQLPLRPGP